MSHSAFLILVPIWLIITVGMCVLQVFLSRRKHFIFGLILPTVSFVLIAPIMVVLIGYMLFIPTEFNENANVIDYPAQSVEIDPDYPDMDNSEVIIHGEDKLTYGLSIVGIFFVILIIVAPPILLLIIFFICRALMKKQAPQLTINPNKEIDKMNILDLE
ncbi:MAG: hypothetical protein FWD34_01490 [Oscillospiraceae bacterium]|nr:hypothetical protein [Oscillospiraceae bacterium]